MVYASYSRGYKAGGFNLDRSALKSPILPFAAVGGAQALVGNLQFDPETVDSYEIGAKYSTGPFGLGLTFFRSDFSSFQLNTFTGTVFLVQNVNGCDSDLAGGDRSEEHTSELQSLMRISYAVFCLTKNNILQQTVTIAQEQ